MSTPQNTALVKTISTAFLRAYIITMRPYLMFVSGITGLVGMSFIPRMTTFSFVLRFAASFLSYGFGQALTDCFQIDTDSLSSPYRPLTRGIISRLQACGVSVVGLTFCISVFASGNPTNLLLGVVAGTGLATYTYFKRRWWGGPFYNAWIVAVLCSMAFLSGGGRFAELISQPMAWVLLAVFAGYANFVLSGYFKDIEADRPTGYFTLPVVFGRRASAWISDLFALVAAGFALVVIAGSETGLRLQIGTAARWAFFIGAIGTSALAQWRLHKVNTDAEAHRAIAPVVHSYILLLSALTCVQKPEWSVFLVLFYISFILVLRIRPEQHQI
ncbi:MAG TPA: UbiA family prenyltransferase [Bacteroidota bacterium]|nr:UbiA family prenyltransferase [Bacteroidota bacterium]